MTGTPRYFRSTSHQSSVMDELTTALNTIVDEINLFVAQWNAKQGGASTIIGNIGAFKVVGCMVPTTQQGATVRQITATSGSGQSATAFTAVTNPLVATVTDGAGAVVVGETVTWSSTSDAQFSGASATDASGQAAISVVAGTSAGSHTIVATTTTGTTATFTLTVTAAAAASMAANSVTDQSGTTSTAVAAPPSVRITDAYGNVVSGTTVTYAVTGGGGSRSPATVNTDASGIATLTSWTLGATAGLNTLTATAAGLSGSPVTFTANGSASAPTQISVASGGAQTGVTAGSAATAVVVLVRDVGSSPVQGVTVRGTVTTGTGSLNVASGVTNASGNASFTYTTGTTVETATLTFDFTNAAGSSVSVSTTCASTFGVKNKLGIQTQPSSNGSSGTALGQQPIIQIQDANGNVVTSATDTVTAAVQSGNASITAGSTKAAVQGVATFTGLTMTDADGGANILRFSSGALTVVDSTGTTLTPPVPAKVQFATQPSNVVQNATTLGCTVQVVDSSNVLVPGATDAVTITLSAGGTMTGTATVNAVAGVATFSGLSVDTVGTYTLTATSGTLTSATSTSFTVSASGGVVGHPNEPAGMTALTNQPWDALPGIGTNDAYGWKRNTAGNNSIQVDATAPASPSNVLRVQFPTSLSGGTAPEQIVYTISGTSRKRLYLHFQIYVDPNWTNNGNTATKLLFFCQHDSKNHYIEFIQGSAGTGPMFRYQAQHNDSGASNSTGTSSFNATAANKGRWLDVEIIIYTGTAGGANGTYDLWVDGVKRATNTGISFFLAAQAGKEYWNTIYLNSIYGGGANSPPQALYFQIDHFYASASNS